MTLSDSGMSSTQIDQIADQARGETTSIEYLAVVASELHGSDIDVDALEWDLKDLAELDRCGTCLRWTNLDALDGDLNCGCQL